MEQTELRHNGVLGGSEEVADLEGLLDPAEEQFDLPASLVEVGDLVGRGVEIVGEDAQLLAGLGQDAHLANTVLEGVPAAARQACGQVADAVRQDGRARRDRQILKEGEWRARLEAGDDAAAVMSFTARPVTAA